VSVRGCAVVAIDGTHASGKTTLVHALTAHYRARGVLVACTGEPARTSPFIEETVIHGKGDFDLATEVDLFGAQLSATLRGTRHQQLLVCDKTVVNVLAYARLLLPAPPGSHAADVLDAMTAFCRAWAAATYDAVFFLPDAYRNPPDPMRSKVTHLQDQTTTALRAICADVRLPLLDLPVGLDLTERVAFIAQQTDALLPIAAD